ncbi:MAG: flagellar biosynthesis protein FlhF [Pyrinomonadaceae bacterium]
MNIKKYRAASTRGALEMIKNDLGEHAFVLETKQVRTGGFLGLRSKMQIEVSAASPSVFSRSDAGESVDVRYESNRGLNLSSSATVAQKTSSQSNDLKRQNLISALSARTASGDDLEKRSLVSPLRVNRSAIESVEISSQEPRLVYPKRNLAKSSLPNENETAEAISEATPSAAAPNRDLELLRAELREVKFSLGAFTNRHGAQSWQTDVDMDIFGKIFEAPFYETYVELTGTGISDAFARKIVADIIPLFNRTTGNEKQLTMTTLSMAISSLVNFEQNALPKDRPSVLAMIGATGVGKTTTIAKLAASLSLFEHRRVELVTLDTYRIAAVEQLKTYAEIIGAGCQVVRSVSELDQVLHKMAPDATILIDTTGRNPHDLADQYELSDYLQQHKEIRKCLAIQATTHPLDALAAIRKYEMYGADCLAVTKMDETMRPGSVIETIAESNLPLAYICAGQRVPEDLQMATVENLANRILGNQI